MTSIELATPKNLEDVIANRHTLLNMGIDIKHIDVLWNQQIDQMKEMHIAQKNFRLADVVEWMRVSILDTEPKRVEKIVEMKPSKEPTFMIGCGGEQKQNVEQKTEE